MLHHSLLGLVLAASLSAQVAPHDILLSELGTTGQLRMVSPQGTARSITGVPNRTYHGVALDPRDPAAVWGVGSWLTVTGIPVGHLRLRGSVAGKGPADGTVRILGRPRRCHVYRDQLLFTVNSGAAGLYTRPRAGGAARLIYKIADAWDIAVLDGKAYVSTWSSLAAVSKLFEVELDSFAPKVRQVMFDNGSLAVPTNFKALCTYGWEDEATYVLVGGAGGRLWWLDPTKTRNNIFHTTFGVTQGMAEALSLHPDAGVGMVVATSNALYKMTAYNSGGAPFFRTRATILDIAVLGGGMESYGAACAGAQGVPRLHVGLDGWPWLGNGKFLLECKNTAPSVTGQLVLGLSRSSWTGVPLPLKLDSIGATGCFLNAELLLQVPTLTSALGETNVLVPIPSLAGLKGLPIYAQWAIFEPGANPAGLVSSRGLRITPR